MSVKSLKERIARLRTSEAGQTLIEYAGMVLLVSISVILLLGAIGLDVAEVFDELEDGLGLGDPNVVDTDNPGVDDQAVPTGVN